MSYLDQFAPQPGMQQPAQATMMAPGAGGQLTPQQMQALAQLLQGGAGTSAASATPAGGINSLMQGIQAGSKNGIYADQIKGMFAPQTQAVPPTPTLG